ncbi:glycosyl hydrolase family 5 [Pelomonas sp. Root1217]|uniref:glycoside hydrolase family 5 protein n=1 Tax=Pelomonas sp. Root1217 TaxID=1736430 RepID=UPI00070E0E3A|nr:glycoside hydrolase family 5 protein [Pelomonas sp. Root1217]KQV59568.1 glycosyl hydrolase family 5 [Pelomonas sp. Root1217]
MKHLLLKALCLLSALPTLAAAQSCGSGGGATVCLNASGTADNVQLQWSVSGNVSRLEVYRDTDADPNGRTRIATPAVGATNHTDATAADGTRYWYWVRFTTNAGSYNSGSANALRNASCPPTTITPYMKVNGSWSQTASAVVSAGASVGFGPQPVTGGSWAWSGCGTSGSAREQNVTASNSCTATATYTNPCGGKSLQAFTLIVPGTMRDLTSVQLSKLMAPGINLGNTLEAIPTETSWNGTLTTQATMDGYKAAGFKSVRIPVSYSQYADANNNISPTWLARVKQVVDYARKAGLYAMINIHWDGGWLNHPTDDQQPALNAKLTKFWTQIANTFKDYDDYLLFAGTNEVGMDAPWGTPISSEWANVQNGFNQTFVNAVRATGGNNAKRHLVVQTYFTDINNGMAVNTVPTDTVAGRLFMEAHYYDPFNFTINGGSTIWQWGAGATDPTATETWANEAWVEGQFQKMKTRYVDQGVGFIIGEFGAYVKPAYPGMAAYRNTWAGYVSRSIVQHGGVPMWWDTGEVIDRATGAPRVPELIKALVDATR